MNQRIHIIIVNNKLTNIEENGNTWMAMNGITVSDKKMDHSKHI